VNNSGSMPVGKASGTFGGAQIGFNYQFDRIVIGLEGTWSGIKTEKTISSPYYPGEDIETTKVGGLVTVAGRLGFAWDRVLIYGKGGWAQGRVEVLAASTDGPSFWNPGAQNRNGSVIGAGLEFMVTPNIIAGVEYNHIDLGKANYSAFNTGGDTSFASADDRTSIDTVTGRLSYKFDGLNPFKR
jgi:outer membrane immunogenic protein